MTLLSCDWLNSLHKAIVFASDVEVWNLQDKQSQRAERWGMREQGQTGVCEHKLAPTRTQTRATLGRTAFDPGDVGALKD